MRMILLLLFLLCASPAHAAGAWFDGQSKIDVRAECARGLTAECLRKAEARILCRNCTNWADAEKVVDTQAQEPERIEAIRAKENQEILASERPGRPVKKLLPHTRYVPPAAGAPPVITLPDITVHPGDHPRNKADGMTLKIQH